MGDRRLLAAGRLVTPDGVVEGGACVEVEDGRVTRLGARAGIETAPGVPVDDFGDEAWLAPGYVDLQINGGGGADLMAGAGALAIAGRAHLARGVTAFCPTVITAPRDALLRSIDDLARDLERADAAVLPACLGLHVEGPFIAHGARGVHDPFALRDADLAEVDAWQAAARGRIRLVTLAPERAGGLEAVRGLVSRGIAVSIGHTEATAEQVRAAADAGARLVTHTFNGMRGLHHRDVGPVGTALLDERLHPAVIPDGLHVGADALRLFHRLVGSRHRTGRGFLVTDAASPAGLPPDTTGAFTIGGKPVGYAAGRVTDEAGRLAGSALTMDAATATYARLTGASPESALRMATERPVAALEAGLAVGAGAVAASRLAAVGRLVAGGPADLIAVGPDLALRAVYRLGRQVEGFSASA